MPVGTRVQFINQPVKASVEPDGSRYVEIHNPLSQTEEQFASREPVPLTLTAAVNKVVSDASVNTTAMEEALKARSGMPVKVNGAADETITPPVAVPEQEGALPKEEPMTPVTTEGANVVAPAATDAAQPVTTEMAQPAATDVAQPAAQDAAQPAAPAIQGLTQPGPVYSQPKS